jgi:hypothetical protein
MNQTRIKIFVEEQVIEMADKLARDRYGNDFDGLSICQQVEVMEDAENIIINKWKIGLEKVEGELNDLRLRT